MAAATVYDVMRLMSVGNNDFKILQHFLEKVLQIYPVTMLRNKSPISKSQANIYLLFYCIFTQISRKIAD